MRSEDRPAHFRTERPAPRWVCSHKGGCPIGHRERVVFPLGPWLERERFNLSDSDDANHHWIEERVVFPLGPWLERERFNLSDSDDTNHDWIEERSVFPLGPWLDRERFNLSDSDDTNHNWIEERVVFPLWTWPWFERCRCRLRFIVLIDRSVQQSEDCDCRTVCRRILLVLSIPSLSLSFCLLYISC